MAGPAAPHRATLDGAYRSIGHETTRLPCRRHRGRSRDRACRHLAGGRARRRPPHAGLLRRPAGAGARSACAIRLVHPDDAAKRLRRARQIHRQPRPRGALARRELGDEPRRPHLDVPPGGQRPFPQRRHGGCRGGALLLRARAEAQQGRLVDAQAIPRPVRHHRARRADRADRAEPALRGVPLVHPALVHRQSETGRGRRGRRRLRPEVPHRRRRRIGAIPHQALGRAGGHGARRRARLLEGLADGRGRPARRA